MTRLRRGQLLTPDELADYVWGAGFSATVHHGDASEVRNKYTRWVMAVYVGGRQPGLVDNVGRVGDRRVMRPGALRAAAKLMRALFVAGTL